MIALNICENIQDCQQQCRNMQIQENDDQQLLEHKHKQNQKNTQQQQQQQFNQILKSKQQKTVLHSDGCKSNFQIKEICLKADFSQKKIIGGCFKNEQMLKYTNNQEQNLQINIRILDKEDPDIQAFQLSDTQFQKYEPIYSFKEIITKYFFISGATLGIILSSILFFTQQKKLLKDQKLNENNISMSQNIELNQLGQNTLDYNNKDFYQSQFSQQIQK
ncbi:hypothetical protein PPERSA_10455 [Pseudocohnilembus persalinus]|uniref:Transmembrane protein n=1 Tax=Pseudocohnilembus persalinus TaxID=266149 RepID=A0A0V0R151_PSEPJ|nr:hypothetical protein PPERSA_10455 [Pseudocohnilembus persalinus]|eukprot:KRX08093.1 hypothetical protein PPERSA_10455 [Pseudocohnilembus persalinus]